jgi:lysylphosphatidylglycerol synthetase-like protein (DUF2156 family)
MFMVGLALLLAGIRFGPMRPGSDSSDTDLAWVLSALVAVVGLVLMGFALVELIETYAAES